MITTQKRTPLASPNMAPICRSNWRSFTRLTIPETILNTNQIAKDVRIYSTSMGKKRFHGAVALKYGLKGC